MQKKFFHQNFFAKAQKIQIKGKINQVNKQQQTQKNLLAFKFEKIIDSDEKFIKNQYLHIFSVNKR